MTEFYTLAPDSLVGPYYQRIDSEGNSDMNFYDYTSRQPPNISSEVAPPAMFTYSDTNFGGSVHPSVPSSFILDTALMFNRMAPIVLFR